MERSRNWATSAVLILLVPMVLAGAGAAGGSTSIAARTTTARVYQAFSPRGRSLVTGRTVRGTCNGGSLAIDRRDAWRCFRGNGIIDPCFSSGRVSGFVLCPRAAWKRTGIRLELTAPLRRRYGNRPKPSLRALPWGLELYDGRRCGMTTGATNAIGGLRANYACDRGADWLWGSPSRSVEPWTIFAAPFDASSLMDRVAIRRAWM